MSVELLLAALKSTDLATRVSAAPTTAPDALFSDVLDTVPPAKPKPERSHRTDQRAEPKDAEPTRARSEPNEVDRPHNRPDAPARSTDEADHIAATEKKPLDAAPTAPETVDPAASQTTVALDEAPAQLTLPEGAPQQIETGLATTGDETTVAAAEAGSAPQPAPQTASVTSTANGSNPQAARGPATPTLPTPAPAPVDDSMLPPIPDLAKDGFEAPTFVSRPSTGAGGRASEGFQPPTTVGVLAGQMTPQNQMPQPAAPQIVVPPQLADMVAKPSGQPLDIKLDNAGLAPQQQRGGMSTTAAGSPRPSFAKGTPLRMDAIALRITQAARSGETRFQIQLDPPELGRIDVKLEFSQEGQMRAHLAAERPETLDLLQRDARALHKALETVGLKLDDSALNFSMRDSETDDSKADGSAAASTNDSAGDDEDAEAELAVDTHALGGNLRAALGGVDRLV